VTGDRGRLRRDRTGGICPAVQTQPSPGIATTHFDFNPGRHFHGPTSSQATSNKNIARRCRSLPDTLDLLILHTLIRPAARRCHCQGNQVRARQGASDQRPIPVCRLHRLLRCEWIWSKRAPWKMVDGTIYRLTSKGRIHLAVEQSFEATTRFDFHSRTLQLDPEAGRVRSHTTGLESL
jgi:hypothetical protein